MTLFNLKRESEKRLSDFFKADLKEKIKQTEDKFRTVFDSSADGILFLNKSGIIIDANQKIKEITGYPSKFFIGKHLNELEELLEKKSLTKIKKTKNPVIKLKTKKGRELYIELNLFTMKRDKKIVGNAVIFKDITMKRKMVELKMKRRQEKELNKIKGRLLMRVSHELRHPLVPITGYAGLLKNKVKKKDQPIVDKVINNANQLTTLVNNVITLTSIQSGNIMLKKESVDLSKLINQEINKISLPKNVRLVKKLVSGLKINADPNQLRKVIDNLVSSELINTTKGTITVKLSKEEKKVIIMINNNNRLLSNEEVKNVDKSFNDIYTNDDYEQMYKGFSLGFLISKKLIKLHDGQLTIKSKQTEGTTIKVKLPIK